MGKAPVSIVTVDWSLISKSPGIFGKDIQNNSGFTRGVTRFLQSRTDRAKIRDPKARASVGCLEHSNLLALQKPIIRRRPAS